MNLMAHSFVVWITDNKLINGQLFTFYHILHENLELYVSDAVFRKESKNSFM